MVVRFTLPFRHILVIHGAESCAGLNPADACYGFYLLYPKPCRVTFLYRILLDKPTGQDEASLLSFEGAGLTVTLSGILHSLIH